MVRISGSLSLSVFVPYVAAALINIFPPEILGNPPLSSSSNFTLQENIIGEDFLTHFDWETFDDPTHGRVNYVSKSIALERNLTFATSKTFIMRADGTNIVQRGARGRDSNRIKSYTTYADSLLVLDVKHVPWGCATWPAFWTVTPNGWPNGGEIDIIEGVNQGTANQATLHTSRGCEMDQNREQTGTTVSTDCAAYDGNNEGCGTTFTKPNSYGPGLNDMGGGWYVMKRTQSDGLYVWFFGRNDPSVPAEISGGYAEIYPDGRWGVPDARFPSTNRCDFASHFDAHEIVFDLTFCGDWAGGTFSSGCGPASCQDFVDNNPQAFQDAYWEINALRVYVPGRSLLMK